MHVKLNTTFCVYCQTDSNCALSSRINTEENHGDNICHQNNQDIDEDIVINGQDAEEDYCDYVDDGDGEEGSRRFLYSRDSDAAASVN